jgi:hypothetical protein
VRKYRRGMQSASSSPWKFYLQYAGDGTIDSGDKRLVTYERRGPGSEWTLLDRALAGVQASTKLHRPGTGRIYPALPVHCNRTFSAVSSNRFTDTEHHVRLVYEYCFDAVEARIGTPEQARACSIFIAERAAR